jgi:aerobic carbon-monoxide dehydrogenase medium subunit
LTRVAVDWVSSAMKPASFDYFRPDTLEEAAALLATYGDDAKLLAGGQTLVPMMNFRLATPRVLIDINEIKGLDFIQQQNGSLCLGALVRWHEIESSSVVAQSNPMLGEAVRSVAHYQIRNRGTWAGSCAHADPAAEFPAVALISKARFTLFSTRGRRVVSVDEFFLGPLTTALTPDEILVDVEMPLFNSNTIWAFEEFALRNGDFAIAGVAVVIEPNDQEDFIRFVSFGVSDKACRLRTAESVIATSGLTHEAIDEAAASIKNDIDARSDIHASADYRLALTKALLERTLHRASVGHKQ